MITAAAIRRNGLIFSIPPPARHHHIIAEMAKVGVPNSIGDEQGFTNSRGAFVDRELAGDIALADGQITSLQWPPRLFSEDLW